ncbi:helix-hairpin-helix domain-containing protein [Streptomyces sp. NPDC059564]|uniref:helix-hairpin-helix domain-containing protein n=1 Tax=Streptomyces sp. NPDC059564 TaxID=3346865 RepID=UPI003689CEE3
MPAPGYPQDVSALDAKGMRDIPHVGRSVADKVLEYLRIGRMSMVDEAGAFTEALVALPYTAEVIAGFVMSVVTGGVYAVEPGSPRRGAGGAARGR